MKFPARLIRLIALLALVALLLVCGGLGWLIWLGRQQANQPPTSVTATLLLSHPYQYHGQRVTLIDQPAMRPYWTRYPGCFYVEFADATVPNLPTDPPNLRCGARGEVLIQLPVACESRAACPPDQPCMLLPADTEYWSITGTFYMDTDSEFHCPLWGLQDIDSEHIQVGPHADGPWQTLTGDSFIGVYRWR